MKLDRTFQVSPILVPGDDTTSLISRMQLHMDSPMGEVDSHEDASHDGVHPVVPPATTLDPATHFVVPGIGGLGDTNLRTLGTNGSHVSFDFASPGRNVIYKGE
jgi:hypothetical protein